MTPLSKRTRSASKELAPGWALIKRDEIRKYWPGRYLGEDWVTSDLRFLGEAGIRQLYLADQITTAEFEAWIGRLIALA